MRFLPLQFSEMHWFAEKFCELLVQNEVSGARAREMAAVAEPLSSGDSEQLQCSRLLLEIVVVATKYLGSKWRQI